MNKPDPDCHNAPRAASLRSAARLLLAMMLLCAAWPARAEWFYDARAGAQYDDNLTRAQQAADVRGDGAATLAAAAGWFHAPSGADGITLSLEASSEAYARFHGLNLISIGGTASYRHKFGLGHDVPWASISVSAAHDDFRDDIRDSDRLEARLEVGRRLSESLDASLGIAADRRRAGNDRPVVPGISGKVFDLRGQSAFARVAYDVTERLQVGARVSVRRGDVESTTRQNLAIFLASDAIAADPTFGSDFYAYRLRGTTSSANATLSWALSDNSSLNLGYAVARTSAYDDLDYVSRIGTILLVFHY
ncbi:MAG TPA: hypothetical protein VHZ01_12115 [Casimicrobiaceae bacterium]|jgi:hypothetical protein|nr:hypothetical protein [Casimicrobiaceae bacterium]